MALSINAVGSNAGSEVASSSVTITLPGTPQAGDRYVVIASFIGTITNGRSIWSRDWQSGDGTSVTFTQATGGHSQSSGPTFTKHLGTGVTGGTIKWHFIAAWLIRPGASNTVSYVASGDASSGSSGSTDSITLDATPASGDAILTVHANNNKQTAYSNWVNNTFALTEDVESSPGSGSPGNWSSFGAASGITNTASTSVSVDHDDTGSAWTMIAGAFTETAGGSSTPVTVAATSTMTAALSFIKKFPRTIAATSTVTPDVAQKRTFYIDVASTSTVSPSMKRKMFQAIDATTTMTAAMGRKFFETIAATSTMAVDQTRRLGQAVAIAASSTMTAALNLKLTIKRSMDVSTTVTPNMGKFTRVVRTLAATSTMLPDLNRKLFIQIDATSTVAADIARTLRRAVALSVSSTMTPALSRLAQHKRTMAVSSTMTPGMLFPALRKIAMDVTSSMAVTLSQGGQLFQRSIDAVSTMTTALAVKVIHRRTLAVESTMTTAMSRFGKFFIAIAAPVVQWAVGSIGPGGNPRSAAAGLHGDALLAWIIENEIDPFTPDEELVGTLNELAGRYGVEYDEIRDAYLNS